MHVIPHSIFCTLCLFFYLTFSPLQRLANACSLEDLEDEKISEGSNELTSSTLQYRELLLTNLNATTLD